MASATCRPSCSSTSAITTLAPSRAYRAPAQAPAPHITFLLELSGGRDVVAPPDALGLPRGNQVAGKQVPLGAQNADGLRQDRRPPVPRHEAGVDMRITDLGMV